MPNCEPNQMSAVEAMNLSEREDRIVHLRFHRVLANDLALDCDDNVRNGDVTEYWGTSQVDDTQPPSHWRVHLHH